MEGYICQCSGGAQSFPALHHKLPTFPVRVKALRFGNGFGYCYSG